MQLPQDKSRNVRPVHIFSFLFLIATAVVCAPQAMQIKAPSSFGQNRVVSWTTLPEMDGAMCEMVRSIPAAFQGGISAPTTTTLVPANQGRAEVAKRQPLRTIKDPHFGFAGIAVDPIRNEVVIAEENISSIVVYDRRENTPAAAAMSEPKRIIGGDKALVEYACSIYVDPSNGDIYPLNNDTMNWLPVFGAGAHGNVEPKRKLETPHTTFGIAADEQEQELFLTVQDDHAVVVYRKGASEQESPLRILQGSQTQMADPHGIALDAKRGEIFVANWGTHNDRPPLGKGFGGGRPGGNSDDRADFPVGRRHAYPGSGKIQLPSITIFSKKAKGDSAPIRVIQGPKTHLNWPTGLAVHPERGEVFVANDTGDSVIVFSSESNGDVAPVRVIRGPKTQIKNPTGVAVDLVNNELWVASFGNHSALVFPLDASGDQTPRRVIRSSPLGAPAPMLGNPHSIVLDSKRNEILVAN
jgi:DNA-binding beta-propeller fold protein YncE